MKKHLPLIYLLAFTATISGYMIHKLSWVARLGINWFYKEYGIFKSWGKTSIAEFGIFMLLLALHATAEQRAKASTARLIHVGGILASLIGLYITYNDFRHDLSHRMTGERFHIGFYLFWVGWLIIALRFLLVKTVRSEVSKNL